MGLQSLFATDSWTLAFGHRRYDRPTLVRAGLLVFSILRFHARKVVEK